MTGRALVTGAGGFLGRHVIAELSCRGFEVERLRFQFAEDGSGLRVLTGDCIHAATDLDELIAGFAPTMVLHLAGTAGPRLMTEVNVGLAIRLIGAIRRTGIAASLVLVGSAAEYGAVDDNSMPVRETHPCNPLTPYGVSKYAQTLLGLAAAGEGMRVVVARCFNLIGSGMPRHAPLMQIAARLGASAAAGERAGGDLDIERDFIDVVAAARCLVRLGELAAASGQIVNVCSGRGSLLRDVVAHLVAAASPAASPPPWLVADAARRSRVRRMVGHPGRLNALGLSAEPPDFAALAPVILREARDQSHDQWAP